VTPLASRTHWRSISSCERRHARRKARPLDARSMRCHPTGLCKEARRTTDGQRARIVIEILWFDGWKLVETASPVRASASSRSAGSPSSGTRGSCWSSSAVGCRAAATVVRHAAESTNASAIPHDGLGWELKRRAQTWCLSCLRDARAAKNGRTRVGCAAMALTPTVRELSRTTPVREGDSATKILGVGLVPEVYHP
jgi:hypothetical protein